ncbi:MAG: hypothetical protein E7266_07575 [Lachnospiraceae bacterium]|nr:hypothetical protein [Lachnospiraceae bacterium]
MADNKLKRLISLGLVCLMLTPAISFATDIGTDITDTAVTEGTDDEKKEDVDGGIPALPELDRYKEALDRASFDTKEDLLAFYTKYEFLCESTDYEMYYDAETLGIIIRDKDTGAVMESVMDRETAEGRNYSSKIKAPMVSAIAIRTITDLGEVTRNTRVRTSEWTGCVGYVEKVEKLEAGNGFKAHIDYKDLFVSFDFIVSLEEDGVHALVPHDSIEFKEANVCLGDMYVYALMGYTERGDRDGYMIIPDGNGAIVEYEDFIEIGDYEHEIESWKFGSGYSQPVYGDDLSYKSNVATFSEDAIAGANDPEFIYAPYWGMVHRDTQMAFLAVADDGDVSMNVEAVFNGVNTILENYVTPRFIYRKTYYEPKNSNEADGVETPPERDYIDDVAIHYMFANGKEADYANLAVAYRDKLIKEGVLKENNASKDVQVRVDMLGTDKEDFLIFKKTVTATTVDNIRTIIDTLTDNGVSNMMVIYNGWQSGGVYNVPVSEYKVDSAIGGKASLNALASDLKKQEGIDFFLGQETQYINATNVKTTFDAAKKITKFTYNETRRFEEVYRQFRVLYPEISESNLVSLVNDFVDNGIENIAVEGMPSNIFTYTKKKVLFTRQDTINYYLSAFKTIGEDMTVAMNQPFKVFWSEMDAFLDMPLGHSMYNYESSEIPFLSIVLNGTIDCYSEYVNFEADKSEYFLKLAAYGVNPSFLLTYENPSILQYTNSNWIYTSEYVHYVDQIATYYKELGELKGLTEGSVIVDYEYDNYIGITTYANGLQVYCDYKNYLLAAFKDGNMVYGYNPQEEVDLTEAQAAIMKTYVAIENGQTKVESYIGTAIAKTHTIAVKYNEVGYSNGVTVYDDYNANIRAVAENGNLVYGYNTVTGEELSQDELKTFADSLSNVKEGEVNE